jgi:hypothetical protein
LEGAMNSYNVIGQRIDNSGLVTYLLSLPIRDALQILEIPDPGKPFPGNRRVNKKHAMEFGNYWEKERGNWVVPPILIDSETPVESRLVETTSAVGQVYELTLPVQNFGSLKILDGQHRILGWYLKSLELGLRKSDAISLYNRAVGAGDSDLAGEYLSQISILESLGTRLDSESISVTIIDSLDEKRHQQFFVDIAKNALGINKTVQAKFDNSSVINRVTQYLVKNHPLLVGHVDLEKTTCSGTNRNLLSVVNVADVVRHVSFGISSRVTARKEVLYEDDAIAAVAKRFFDVSLECLPILQRFVDQSISAPELRDKSLLGSGTIWRCLAGAYFAICVQSDETAGDIHVDREKETLFRNLLENFSLDSSLPISQRWFLTGLFPNNQSKAPSSRAQDLTSMVQILSNWATSTK